MSDSSAHHIIKQNGESEPFRPRKLRASLRRAGATNSQIRQVVADVRKRLHGGMTTRKLYRIAFQALRRLSAEHEPVAARYSLKRAVMELGPSGYPFEQLIAALFASDGQAAKASVTLRGKYVSHEVDVVVGRGRKRQLCECKFRTHSAGKVDVKVAMYVYARAQDLRGIPHGYDKYWIVTNGRFTKDAIAFGKGMGLELLGWNHPENEGLEHRIERSGIHPVTALSPLAKKDKAKLLQKGIVLCSQFLEADMNVLARFITKAKLEKARKEARALVGPAKPRRRRSSQRRTKKSQTKAARATR